MGLITKAKAALRRDHTTPPTGTSTPPPCHSARSIPDGTDSADESTVDTLSCSSADSTTHDNEEADEGGKVGEVGEEWPTSTRDDVDACSSENVHDDVQVHETAQADRAGILLAPEVVAVADVRRSLKRAVPHRVVSQLLTCPDVAPWLPSDAINVRTVQDASVSVTMVSVKAHSTVSVDLFRQMSELRSMRALSLNRTFIDSDVFPTLALIGRQLRELDLTDILSAVRSADYSHLTKLRRLEKLRVCHIDRATMVTIAESLSLLRELSITHSAELTEPDVEPITNLKKLRVLTLRGCRKLHSVSFLQQMPKLHSLTITAPAEIMPVVVHLPRLQVLDLSQGINRFEFPRLNGKLSTRLHTLNLSSCNNMGIALFSGIERFRALTDLNLTLCPQVCPVCMMHLKALPKLESLNLSMCPKLDAAALHHVGQIATLTSLNISMCPEVDAPGVMELCGLPNLHLLNLNGCKKIGTLALSHIGGSMARLQTLELTNCPEINEQGIMHLANLRSLQVLTLANCPLVDASAVRVLADLALPLTSLNLSSCPDIDAAALSHIGLDIPGDVDVDADPVGAASTGLHGCGAGGMQQLLELKLARCTKVDAAALGPVLRLPRLRTLYVRNCGVSEAALQREHPAVEILPRRKLPQ